jgi:hypothetical protein
MASTSITIGESRTTIKQLKVMKRSSKEGKLKEIERNRNGRGA